MKNMALVFVFICYTNQTLASTTPLYFAPLVDLKDQQSYAKVHEDELEVFSKKYLENKPDQKNANELLNNFELAQKYYLVKSMELAREYYQKIANLQDRDEWKDIHRKIIFLSLVRLSELDPANAEEWLRKAISFSPDMDLSAFDFSSDQKDKLKNIKKELNDKAITWSIQTLQKDFSYILLNGHVIDLSKYDNIRIPAGSYRITYLSNIFKPQTYQVTSQQIPFIEPSRIPFVSGECDHPQFNKEGENIDQLAIYYSPDCVQYFQNNHWSKESKPNLIPKEEVASLAPTTLTSQIEEKPFYKKTWFWILTASVAAGVIIYANQRKNSEPSHDVIRF